MRKEEAQEVLALIKKVCRKYGLWLTVETEEKPDLKFIRIKEISIKIDGMKIDGTEKPATGDVICP